MRKLVVLSSHHEMHQLTFLDCSDHISELKNAKPKQPFFFLKPPSSMLLPGEGACLRPKGVSLHYEVELALVIGKRIQNLKPDDQQGAIDAVRGTLTYCVSI